MFLVGYLQAWVGYISIGYISGIYIQRPDIWCGYISSFQIGYLDIAWNGYGYWIFLLYIISIWAAGYRIWIYIQFLPADMDRILYPKKVDMTQAWNKITELRRVLISQKLKQRLLFGKGAPLSSFFHPWKTWCCGVCYCFTADALFKQKIHNWSSKKRCV